MKFDFHAVVMGVSAGGFKALNILLPMFPKNFSCPVIIVHHGMPAGDDFFVNSLNTMSKLIIKEAEDKEQLKTGKIYIAPGNYHLLVEKDYTLSLSVDKPVCYARPSIDVLFETAARAFGPHLIGIILTGASCDGSNGIRIIKANKGLTIAQDPNTAEVNLMPGSAIATQCVDFILSLEDIPSFITGLLEDDHEGCKS
ncbi:chemotaxis protein CheB [Desulfobacula toluolica]|uniref:protein-glutamate methylesterase n=1 Tax=Desulfobacula toluolica (strain DSM 7467 / Tol2) TaxID=651182 RepID=K0NLT7_DESTT|nr:chemotaxis protein CheB [Desulfobacula toluolica]CCK79627.1 CheB: predicted chemotaxis protein-glutamate methylesterase [Desulfobacula toluolica Tol2]